MVVCGDTSCLFMISRGFGKVLLYCSPNTVGNAVSKVRGLGGYTIGESSWAAYWVYILS